MVHSGGDIRRQCNEPTCAMFFDLSLNVRVILLIRDPRGSLQSRKHRVWCPGRPDCDHPPTVCNDMQADYEAAVELTKQYPNKFSTTYQHYLLQ
ncbi:hypothetical protein pipiens_016944 [Culex pipiens pipiens]|uniref:Sulfotransferase domain-containing protein n=1 Tax=Culex pipiens pipiens TaxID=38569 RepID=A0ABD1CJ40_CULPP